MTDDTENKPQWGGHNATPELTEREIELCKHMASIGSKNIEIAEALGITERTFYRILKRQPELGVSLKQAKQNMLNKIKASAFRMALQGDKTMAIFILKTQCGWRDVDVSEFENHIVFKTEILPSGQIERTKHVLGDNEKPTDIIDVDRDDVRDTDD